MKHKKHAPSVKKPWAERIAWHPAFYEGLQLELAPYSDVLRFDFEHPLNTEPLKIDAIIIKKTADIVIEKNIGRLFKMVNIVEFKSPSVSLSVSDFYKVYAYAYLYICQEKIPVTDVTLTFVSERYPREVMRHIKLVRKGTIDKRQNGIYYIYGDILPIQIIETKKLSADENLWLRNLSGNLDAQSIAAVLKESAVKKAVA
jgi:hypothetical protein